MIEEVTPVDGISKATGNLLYIDYRDVNDWRLSSLEGATINSPNRLFTQTDTSSAGRIALITYVENL